ncbi:MAG: hypothetical protein IT379_11185, partial [Deltaproteobacteria bacterium]|nr:hypothetical protein [Deltaproteobacteria bacterium]
SAMGWDVAVYGSLKLPQASVDAWLDAELDATRWNDWRGPFADAEPDRRAPRTVREALALWAKMHDARKHQLLVEVADGAVKVTGLLPKETFVYDARRYVLVFRMAESVGAKGTLTFVGMGNPMTWRLTLAGSKAHSTLDELDEDLEDSPAVLRALAKLPLDEPAPEKKAKKRGKPPPPLELDDATRAAVSEVEAHLRKADVKDVCRALGQTNAWVYDGADTRGLDRILKLAERRDALLARDEDLPHERASRHAAAIQTLVKLDRGAGVPLALRLAAPTTHPTVRAGALFALIGEKSPAAFARFLEAFALPGPKKPKGFPHPAILRRPAADGLVAIGAPLAGERMLGLLTDRTLAIATGPTGDHHDHSFAAMDKQEVVLHALQVIGKVGYRPAWERVVSIFRTHAVRDVRAMAAAVLVHLATDTEIRAVFGQDKQAFIRAHSSGDWFNALAWEPLVRKLVAHVGRS